MSLPEDHRPRRGALFGLAAAALFGLSTPVAKLLLGGLSPVLLAGILYLGAAMGLWLHRALAGAGKEAPLTRNDLPKLAWVVLAGGIAAPVLMLFGLARVSALTGSLLLNLEAPFTVLLAVVVFREHLGRYAAAASGLILVGAVVLKAEPGEVRADTMGILLVALACGAWALDNNLTQRLSLRDPFAVVRVKTLVAGIVNVALGLATSQQRVPSFQYLGPALLLGSVSYGVSVVLDAYALRLVGAAREAAYFATAPFMGAVLSLILYREPLHWPDVAALVSMGLGVVLLLRERHRHVHAHDALEHEHVHEHDAHHRHAHGPGDPPGEPHAHRHQHVHLVHDHPHVPDAHHRHEHE